MYGAKGFRSKWILTVMFLVVMLKGGNSLAQAQQKEQFPKPIYPRYLVNPSKAKLLEAARLVVRQVYGRAPLGKLQKGQTVHVFLQWQQDPQVWEAIKEAWAERGVTAVAIPAWTLPGMTEAEMKDWAKTNLIYGQDGWKEIGVFEPDYIPFLPDDMQKMFGQQWSDLFMWRNIGAYFDKHPEIKFYLAGIGGRTFAQGLAGERHKNKVQLGNWIYESPQEMLSKFGSFPGDVWSLIDDRMVAPVQHVSEGTFTDPEGTNLHWTLTPAQTRHWAEQVSDYTEGHLQVYPAASMATWKSGVIRAASNHTGFQPVMTVHLSEHGRVTKIEGGGKTGDIFRMLLDHPKLKSAKFPTAPEPGYWYLNQDGFGTNPKAVRDVEFLRKGTQTWANMSERNRAGVQHFSFSHPSAGRSDPKDQAYAKANGYPLKHTMHMHVFFPTVKYKLADTGEWITISDKGYIAPLNDPEVRALAAKYGDPNLLLRYEWIPDIPGVNVSGDHEKDYSPDPWGYIIKQWAKIQAGTYEYYGEDYAMKAGSQQ